MADIYIDKMAEIVAQKVIQELKDNGVFVSRWIHVSEGLPERVEWYLTSIKWNDGTERVIISWFDGTSFKAEVIAWMPLPEQYKTESEDKE